MSYINAALSLRPAQYYTLSGITGSVDVSGNGSSGTSAIAAATGPGLVPGWPYSPTSGVTGQNSYRIMSSEGKTKTFTVGLWVNPGAGTAYDSGSQLNVPIFTVPGSGSGIYYYKDKFVFLLKNSSVEYRAEYFAPDPDARYAVFAVCMENAAYLVVNGAPGEPVVFDTPFNFTSSESTFTIGSNAVQHLSIFTSVLPVDNIRGLVAEGLSIQSLSESMAADGGQILNFDLSHANILSDDPIVVDEWLVADKKNVLVNRRGNIALNTVPGLLSMIPGRATGSSFSTSLGYSITGTDRAGTNNFIIVGDKLVRDKSLDRTNLVKYPSAESGTSGWSGTDSPGMTFASSSSQSYSGTKSYECTSSASGIMDRYGLHTEGSAATPGATYTGSVYVRAASTTADAYATLLFWNSGGGFISGPSGTSSADSSSAWSRRTVTATAPAGTAFVTLGVIWTVAGAGEVHYFDAAMIEEGATVGPYFDGGSPGCSWDGTANASTSTLSTYKPSGAGVSRILSSQGAFGATVDFNTGTDTTVFSINTTTIGKEWVVGVGTTGLPYVDEKSSLADGTTGTTRYVLTTAIDTTKSNNIYGVLTESGLVLHTDRNGNNSSINQYSGSNTVPVNITIDGSTQFTIGATSLGMGAGPKNVRGLFFYERYPSNYATSFDSLATASPTVYYPLVSSTTPIIYGETTMTMPLQVSGNIAGTRFDYDAMTDVLDIIGATGLIAYYDARYVNGLTGAASASGAALAQWNDISGNGRHVVQGTTSARPTYSPTGVNGVPSVRFSASAVQQMKYISTDFYAGQSGFTAYSVASPIGVHSASAGYALGPYISTTADDWLIFSLSTSPSTTTGQLWLRSGSVSRSDIASRGLVPDSTVSVFSATVDFLTGAETVAVNGMEFPVTASWATGISSPISNIVLGSTYDGRYLNGDIGAVLLFAGVHTPAQRRAIEGYLATVWGCPSHKGNGFYAKFGTGTYESVRPLAPAPFGPTGSVGTTIAPGPLVVKKTMATYESTWSPEFNGARLTIFGSTGVSGANYSDIASIKTFGPVVAEAYREPLMSSRRLGLWLGAGGQLTIPADTINTYELVIIPGTNIGNGEILCINPGTHYALTVSGLTLTYSGFSSVYLNGQVVSGSATMNPNVANSIIAISSAQLTSSAYLNGHSDGTLTSKKYSIAAYAQYNYQLTAAQVAQHHSTVVGRVVAGVLDSTGYSPAENASIVTYSRTWDTLLSS